MSNALIGYSGFVGGNIKDQYTFTDLYNSKNIEEIKGKTYNYVICSGAPAEKWKANQDPAADLSNINKLINCLKEVQCNLFILISTVDVYQAPIGVTEDTVINTEDTAPYGKHRRYLEMFIENNFSKHLIVRLPALFGTGLKKNFIFDLLNDNCLDWTHKESNFQFYNLDNLWKDISIAIDNKIKLINFSTHPLQAKDIAKHCFDIEFTNITEKPAVSYDMKSKYDNYYSGENGYLYTRDKVIEELSIFVKSMRG